MSYDYTKERELLFTENGQRVFIKIRDKILYHLKHSGAFRLQEVNIGSWEEIACVDRMVELGELIEFKRECWGQYRVFTSPQVHNR